MARPSRPGYPPVVPFYQRLGDVPRKRHVQFRDNGALLTEEVMGLEGFAGNESILYHLTSPCRIQKLGDFEPIERDEWVPDAHAHRHFATGCRARRVTRVRAQAADVEQRRGDLARATGRGDGPLLPERRGRRGLLRARGIGDGRDAVRRPSLQERRLRRLPAGRRTGSSPTRFPSVMSSSRRRA